MPKRSIFLRWLPAVVLMTAIAYLSHQSDPRQLLAPLSGITRFGTMLPRMPDYVAHFVEYFALTMAISSALRHRRYDHPRRSLVWPLLIVMAFAISDELHQAFIPKRSPQLSDLAVDMLGAVCALSLIQLQRMVSRRVFLWVGNARDPA